MSSRGFKHNNLNLYLYDYAITLNYLILNNAFDPFGLLLDSLPHLMMFTVYGEIVFSDYSPWLKTILDIIWAQGLTCIIVHDTIDFIMKSMMERITTRDDIMSNVYAAVLSSGWRVSETNAAFLRRSHGVPAEDVVGRLRVVRRGQRAVAGTVVVCID